MTTRRDFLQRGGCAILGTALPGRLLAAADGLATLEARPARVQLAPAGYPETEIWGYGGTAPGPMIRLRQGERITRRFVNALPEASSVHWHGLRSDNAMDGVSGLTQDAVPPGAGFVYDLPAPDAGTYWYHAHTNSMEQVARGLYGAIVVDEPTPPEVDGDEVLLLDDWRLDPKTAQIDAGFTSMHDRAHAGRWGNWLVTNGRGDYAREVRAGERLRLRLVNAANARIFQLGLDGLAGWVVAQDGMPLDAPMPIEDGLLLAPGQRVDLIVDVMVAPAETASLVQQDQGKWYVQASFPVAGQAASPRREAPAALPPNPRMAVPGLEGARRLTLNMEGGAMGRLETAVLEGNRQSFKQLIDANQFWAFNGVVGLTDTPMAELDRGETVRIRIANDTAFAHAMHLHGMHFREITVEGGLGPLRDTLLVSRGETREIAFVADNPGRWLFHCHMLAHAASGMMTWLRVT